MDSKVICIPKQPGNDFQMDTCHWVKTWWFIGSLTTTPSCPLYATEEEKKEERGRKKIHKKRNLLWKATAILAYFEYFFWIFVVHYRKKPKTCINFQSTVLAPRSQLLVPDISNWLVLLQTNRYCEKKRVSSYQASQPVVLLIPNTVPMPLMDALH